MFYAKLIEFLNELLVLFEDYNKIIYVRLIRLRHKIKNILNENVVTECVQQWLTPEMVDKIIQRNINFLKNTEYEEEVEWMWNELTVSNKNTIWKWIDVLILEL